MFNVPEDLAVQSRLQGQNWRAKGTGKPWNGLEFMCVWGISWSFPKLMKAIDPQIQEAQQASSTGNKESTARLIRDC